MWSLFIFGWTATKGSTAWHNTSKAGLIIRLTKEAHNGLIEIPFCGLVVCYFVRESLDLRFLFF